jgi:hypothetical protein
MISLWTRKWFNPYLQAMNKYELQTYGCVAQFNLEIEKVLIIIDNWIILPFGWMKRITHYIISLRKC